MASTPIEDENQELPSDDELMSGDRAGDPGQPGGGDPTGRSPDDALSKLRAERDNLFDRLARATAEFKNAQKRSLIELDQRAQYANSSLIKSLLPVIDNFERALAVDPEKVDAKTILKGMQIVHDQWLSVLKQQQVQEIAPAPGTPFDPAQHEAIMQQDSPYTSPTVVQLFAKGYTLHDRTLRPAQVAVSKTME